MLGVVAVVLLVCSAIVAAQTPAYVQASRVALRSEASLSSRIVGYVTTNTEVTIERRMGEWCRVRAEVGDAFIACRFLGDSKLTLDVVDAQLSKPRLTPRERLDWESRGFWIAPSLGRLQAVGAALEDALITLEAREKEIVTGIPVLQRHAEFDAMKGYLARGVTVRSLHAGEMWPDGWNPEPLKLAMKRAALPKAAASFFAAGELLWATPLQPFEIEHVNGGVLADALSAVHGIPYRVRILSLLGRYHAGRLGVWDINEVGISFDNDAVVHGITARGTLTGLRISSIAAPLGNQPCSGSSSTLKARTVNSRWRAAIVAWVGRPAPAGKAKVTTRSAGGRGEYEKLVVETIDLDGDGVADFRLLGGVEPARISQETYWKALFANKGGTWVLVDFNQQSDCT